MSNFQIHTASGTDVGKVRHNNQDCGLNADGLYLVCDGMGGGVGGQQASTMTATALQTLEPMPQRSRGMIQKTLDKAQKQVEALGHSLGGVAGTTVTGLVLPTPPSSEDFNDTQRWYVVNIGDSRTYHLDFNVAGTTQAASIHRITKDHSQRQEAIDTGLMTPEVANATIPRNIITQAVGAPDGIRPDYYAADPSGRFIICSDGIYCEMDDTQIAAISARCPAPQEAVDALIDAALAAGGKDNITVIVVDAVPPSTYKSARWSVDKLSTGEDLDSIGDATLKNLHSQL